MSNKSNKDTMSNKSNKDTMNIFSKVGKIGDGLRRLANKNAETRVGSVEIQPGVALRLHKGPALLGGEQVPDPSGSELYVGTGKDGTLVAFANRPYRRAFKEGRVTTSKAVADCKKLAHEIEAAGGEVSSKELYRRLKVLVTQG